MVRIYVSALADTGGETKREREHRAVLGLLAKGLKETAGLSVLPEQLPAMLETAEGGKPYLREHPEICFNLSHSRTWAVCALAETPVGVDVEDPMRVSQALIRRALHPEEQQLVAAYAAEVNRPETEAGAAACRELFFRYWTLKESYLKMLGSGMRTDLRDLCFRLDPFDWDEPVAGPNPAVSCRQWRLDQGSVLSLCVAHDTTKQKREESYDLYLQQPGSLQRN